MVGEMILDFEMAGELDGALKAFTGVDGWEWVLRAPRCESG